MFFLPPFAAFQLPDEYNEEILLTFDGPRSRAHDPTNHDGATHTTLVPPVKLSSEYQHYIKFMLYVKGLTAHHHTLQTTTLGSPAMSPLLRPARIRAFSEVGTQVS